MQAELNELEDATHDSVNRVIESYAVKQDHKASSYTLFGHKLDVIERYTKAKRF